MWLQQDTCLLPEFLFCVDLIIAGLFIASVKYGCQHIAIAAWLQIQPADS